MKAQRHCWNSKSASTRNSAQEEIGIALYLVGEND